MCTVTGVQHPQTIPQLSLKPHLLVLCLWEAVWAPVISPAFDASSSQSILSPESGWTYWNPPALNPCLEASSAPSWLPHATAFHATPSTLWPDLPLEPTSKSQAHWLNPLALTWNTLLFSVIPIVPSPSCRACFMVYFFHDVPLCGHSSRNEPPISYMPIVKVFNGLPRV